MAYSNKKRLAGKVAIITGSGRGIGRCEALLMAQQGATVVVSDIGTDLQVDKLTEEQWDLIADSHLKASFAMIKFAVPVFKRQGVGVIVNTGSEAGLGMIFNSAYAAAVVTA